MRGRKHAGLRGARPAPATNGAATLADTGWPGCRRPAGSGRTTRGDLRKRSDRSDNPGCEGGLAERDTPDADRRHPHGRQPAFDAAAGPRPASPLSGSSQLPEIAVAVSGGAFPRWYGRPSRMAGGCRSARPGFRSR